MLMILSAIDGKLNINEDQVIKEYMEENDGGLVDLVHETSIICSIPTEDYPVHFNNAMNNFYMHSTKNERNHFLDMATRLVAADKKISPRENLFLNELYNAWTEHRGDILI